MGSMKWIVVALAGALSIAPALAQSGGGSSAGSGSTTGNGSGTGSAPGTSANTNSVPSVSGTGSDTTRSNTDPDRAARKDMATGSGAAMGSAASPESAKSDGNSTARPSTATASDAATTLAKLHQGNQAEIQAGKWMQEHAQNGSVKDFAKKMVKDHTAMDKDALSLARKKGVDLTTASAVDADKAKSQQQLQALQDMPAGQADRHYIAMMVKDHQHDLAEVHAAQQAAMGTDQDLSKLLDKSAKKMEDHLKDAQKLQRDMTSRQARTPSQ